MKVLTPCIMFHYYARCAHIMERNTTLTSFIPLVYITGKNNYQHALISDLIEKITMPEEAHLELCRRHGSVCNQTGKAGNNLHIDEGLETKGVLQTKSGAGTGPADSLELSFFSTKFFTSVETELYKVTKLKRGGTNDYDVTSRYEAEARSTVCVISVLKRLRDRNWFGLEHRAMPVVSNVLASDTLALSIEETRKAVNMISHGMHVLNLYARRCSTHEKTTERRNLVGLGNISSPFLLEPARTKIDKPGKPGKGLLRKKGRRTLEGLWARVRSVLLRHRRGGTTDFPS